MGAPPGPGGRAQRGSGAPPVPQHKAPNDPGFCSVFGTTGRNFRDVQASWTARLQRERPVEHDDGVAADADALARLALQAARAAHLDALLDRQARGAHPRLQVGHQRAGSRAGGRVLGDTGEVDEEAARPRRLALGLAEGEVGARAPERPEQLAQRGGIGGDAVVVARGTVSL